MSKVTPKLGLILPGGGSTGLNMPPDRVDVDVLNDNFTKIDTDAGIRADKVTALETGMGLVIVRPDSVTGRMDLQADGSASKASLVSGRTNIDGVFKNEYDRYRMITSLTLKNSASASTDMLARINGVDYTGANYYRQQIGREATSDVAATAGGQPSFGGIIDGAGTLVEAVSDILIGASFMLISSTVIARGGVVSTYVKTANVEALSARPTGLGIDFGQSIQNAHIRFYAYR